MAVSAKLSKPTGQKISKVRKQQFFFQFYQSYSFVNRKVWYRQIWIPNNLGFIVSDLMYIPHVCFVMHTCKKHATVHKEKWQDMELCTMCTVYSGCKGVFTYMIKIYVPKSENSILPAHHLILLPKVAIALWSVQITYQDNGGQTSTFKFVKTIMLI